MNLPESAACLSLAPNLRCVPLNYTQYNVLIIPPAIELVFCIVLILLKWRSDRAHLLLAMDGVFYFTLALVDLFSHIIPTARNSITTFKAADIFIGSGSFIPMLLYTSYLFWMSYREFVISLPLRHQSTLKYLLIILILIVITTNEAASFAGISIRYLPVSQATLMSDFTSNSESLWLSLSQLSLAMYTIIQMLFFLLAFYRLGEAFRDRQRIEIIHADEHHHFNGIGWITVGIQLGVVETIVGFAMGGFAVPLSRRIIRTIARGSLIIGVLKGMDTRESFEYLTNELASWRHSVPFSNFYRHMSRRASPHPQERPPTESITKGSSAGQHVTVHCEGGRAPFLQIRFSGLSFPELAIVPGLRSSTRSSFNNFAQLYGGQKTSTEMRTSHHDARHIRSNHMHGSGSVGTISDSMSVIRELSQRFPLPPRVTGKYRGSILGRSRNDSDDEFPLVGVSREVDVRHEGAQGAAAGSGNGVVRSVTGSIKRKPAPPLLLIPQPAHTNRERLVSSWGGLNAQNGIEFPAQSCTTPMTPGPVVDSPSSAITSYGTARPRPRQLTPRQLFDRASAALSIISIRSAEWLSSARSQPSARPPLTLASIEAYYNGGTVTSPQRTYADNSDGDAETPGEESLGDGRYGSRDDVVLAETPQSQLTTQMSIGHVRTRTTPTPTIARFPLGREPIPSSYGEVQGWNCGSASGDRQGAEPSIL